MLDSGLYGIRRHARRAGKAKACRSVWRTQRVTQIVVRLPHLLRAAVKVGFQVLRLHSRLIGQRGNQFGKAFEFLIGKRHLFSSFVWRCFPQDVLHTLRETPLI